ncbi:hypothetical protein OG535_01795 [Kitasatospora sp. NBC_00085]|uniref:hypothetical protein n=1 Tax=Kitasatospora sp. NBC_00085 TaxID=2903566 RepID=UPI003253BBFC
MTSARGAVHHGPAVSGAGPSRTAARRWVAVAGLAGAWAMFGGLASPAAAAAGSLITVVDNSHGDSLVRADSLVEIDRTANLQTGKGTAGSDHDGAGALVGDLLAGRWSRAPDDSPGDSPTDARGAGLDGRRRGPLSPAEVQRAPRSGGGADRCVS